MVFANVRLPNAKRDNDVKTPEHVRSLVDSIRNNCSTPKLRITVKMIATALGISDRALQAYMAKPRRNARGTDAPKKARDTYRRRPPYMLVYGLEVLASDKRATAFELGALKP